MQAASTVHQVMCIEIFWASENLIHPNPLCAGVSWVGEWLPVQRQSPELTALRQAVHEQGIDSVGRTLEMAADNSDLRAQSPAQALTPAAWQAVDVDYVADASGVSSPRVAIDVMLVHQLLPLAAGLSEAGKASAQARILQLVTSGGDPAGFGADAAASARTVQTIQVSCKSIVAAHPPAHA